MLAGAPLLFLGWIEQCCLANIYNIPSVAVCLLNISRITDVMAVTNLQLAILIVVGIILFHASYKNRKVLPSGVKPLPGPKGKGQSFVTLLYQS